MSKKRRSIFGRSGIKKRRAPNGWVWKTRKITRGRNKGMTALWF